MFLAVIIIFIQGFIILNIYKNWQLNLQEIQQICQIFRESEVGLSKRKNAENPHFFPAIVNRTL